MENPASWTDTTHAIQKAIDDHKAAQDAGAIGGSLAMYIETVVFEPRIAALTQPVTHDEVIAVQTKAGHSLQAMTYAAICTMVIQARAALAAGPRVEEK